ncbi:sortase [Ruminococcus sp.]|jgi:sortase A|uniref:sortase n=1 Tax=Ruminococcus sp. TaxID=41978 RepID=UPI0025FA4FC3|nr:sortase [Ruminococcus sp.]
MRKKIKTALIFTGILMLIAAAALCVFNIIQDRRAYEKSQNVLTELKRYIPEPTEEIPTKPSENPADDLFLQYEQVEEEEPIAINVDGIDYSGYISLPSLGLELPIIDNWSYDALEISPCRFSGTASGNDLIIAAHNYNSHFGRINELENGAEFSFIDTRGNIYRYTVEDIRVLDGSDSEGMFSGSESEWDITLFTCTLSGQARVAVRGSRCDK